MWRNGALVLINAVVTVDGLCPSVAKVNGIYYSLLPCLFYNIAHMQPSETSSGTNMSSTSITIAISITIVIISLVLIAITVTVIGIFILKRRKGLNIPHRVSLEMERPRYNYLVHETQGIHEPATSG